MEMNMKYQVEVTKNNLSKTYHLTSTFLQFQEDEVSVIYLLQFEEQQQQFN